MPAPHVEKAIMDGDFTVFLLGLRVHAPLKPHKWVPVLRALPRVLTELQSGTVNGFLSGEVFWGRTTLCLQYWKSFDHLQAYARDRTAAHLPAWTNFNLNVDKTAEIGLWHETYHVKAGAYENTYVNMPALGLGRAGRRETARGG